MKKLFLFLTFIGVVCMSYAGDRPGILTGALRKLKPTAIFKIYCEDCNKRILSENGRIAETNDNDVITITVYGNLNEPEVNIKSKNFGFEKTLKGNWTFFSENDIEMPTENDKIARCIMEGYTVDKNLFISYVRSEKGEGQIKPLLQMRFGDINYNFNVLYGKVYDKDKDNWVFGAVITSDPNDDKVRMKLRSSIGNFCKGFNQTISDRLKTGDGPW